jgi:hypothetical protein
MINSSPENILEPPYCSTIFFELPGAWRSPFAVRRSHFAVRRSPFALRRSHFAVRTSHFAVRRSPFAVRRSPFGVWRLVFNREKSHFGRGHRGDAYDTFGASVGGRRVGRAETRVAQASNPQIF